MSGRLTALTNGVALIGGRSYRVPLALPPALESRRLALRERLLRNEALLKAGAKTPDAAAAQRAKLEATWRRSLKLAQIDEATRAYWLVRLMESGR